MDSKVTRINIARGGMRLQVWAAKWAIINPRMRLVLRVSLALVFRGLGTRRVGVVRVCPRELTVNLRTGASRRLTEDTSGLSGTFFYKT